MSDLQATHIPVLLHESIEALDVRPNRSYVDATAGQGGHSALMLERSAPRGVVYAIEWDERACVFLRKRFAQEIACKRFVLMQGNFADMAALAAREHVSAVSGILFDFGFSRFTVEAGGRGFSFRSDEPLVMAYDAKRRPNARDLVNELSEQELAAMLWQYGEERLSRRIAANIVRARAQRAIGTSGELACIVSEAYPARLRHGRLHPATRTFQALRIAVNHELENIADALPQAVELLESGGRLVTLAYHSLEDRIVKQFMRQAERNGEGTAVSQKPLAPSADEMRANPSSRSAKLRAFEKI